MTAKQDKPTELLPNPWKTFERAIDAKSPPQHRVVKDKPKTKKAKKSKRKGRSKKSV
jgi:hypothetical protein